MKTLLDIFADAQLRKRILFVIGILIISRFLTIIPIPQVSADNLALFLQNNSFFGFLNVFSGGGLSAFSIMMLGVGPYITGSIIMQLMTVLVPRLKEMYQEEGENGRRKFVQYGRLLTVPLAFLQGFALLTLLTKQNVIPALSPMLFLSNLVIITAASMLLMWLGEQINDRGIGNGVSLIIFSGIIAALPQSIGQYLVTFDPSQIPALVAIIVLVVVVVAGIVYVTEAERPIPITYAKQSRIGAGSGGVGASTYLPLRLNQAGVVPIIFAISILLLPQFATQLLALSPLTSLQNIAKAITSLLANQWVYGGVYFFLVVLFTYFYTAVTFDPEKTADNLQKSGAFIPGFRPGLATAEYVAGVLSRVTLVGALFLGVVALLPIIVQGLTGITAVAVGGTSLLIAVSVILDLIKKIDAQLAMREY
jgi:preprotein translocase subunit SecY